ncbi:MAG: ABC transporter ATP-binding protein [Mycoplasmataceae bacterium]|nr:ABC transporter ATP-binding protein [Mycoplasmataceae bacterium]
MKKIIKQTEDIKTEQPILSEIKTFSNEKHKNLKKVPALFTHKYFLSDIQEYTQMPIKPILFVRGLSKRYFRKKSPAIEKISFDVFPGQFHAFIGANGAGKTTTIKCLIGAYANWSGTVLINGVKNSKEEAKRKLGYIPENARFPEKFSAFRYLQWMVMLSGFSSNDAREYAADKLKSLKMWSLRKKSPNSFSSGQKKKILLAQALIHDPDIIIMDEPVANLDPKARIEFFNLLLDLKQKGKAIFISSHVLAELDRYSDSATVLDGGRIVYDGDRKKLMSMFSKNGYEVSVDKENLVIDYLKKHKIPYKKNEENNNLIIEFENKKLIANFQEYLVSHKVDIILFKKVEPSLEQVYEKLVIKGSVDTMKE